MEVELDLSKKIVASSVSGREKFVEKIKELKGILKIPRLYTKYTEKLRNLVKLDE